MLNAIDHILNEAKGYDPADRIEMIEHVISEYRTKTPQR